MVKISDLRNREVINVIDGKRLGLIKDIEINLAEGRIESLIVPGQQKLFGVFGRNDEIVIPWYNIKKIGIDVLLVEVTALGERKNFVENKHISG